MVVDPDDGMQILHVKNIDTDPVKGYIEYYTTSPTPPGDEMFLFTKDENGTDVRETHNYTFVSCKDFTGKRFYLTGFTYCRYDLVDKYTGLVELEIEGPPVPFIVKNPTAKAQEILDILKK